MAPGTRAASGPRLDPDRRAEIEQRSYDPRREERRKLTRLHVPEDVDARMLDQDARRELRGLTRETADLVARHLVMTGRLLDEEPERALAHARAARAMAGRIGVVRQASGLAAYAAGEWAEALSELRAARRITGRPEHLSVMADCERALDRPERALAYADDAAVTALPQDERVELVIVVAGARRDLGQADAAVLALQDPARNTTAARPWAARLWYAYADALLDAGREDEARAWFEKAADVDSDGATDAGERLLELDGVVLEDLGDEDEDGPGGMPDAELAAVVAQAFPGAAGPRSSGGGGRRTGGDEVGSEADRARADRTRAAAAPGAAGAPAVGAAAVSTGQVSRAGATGPAAADGEAAVRPSGSDVGAAEDADPAVGPASAAGADAVVDPAAPDVGVRAEEAGSPEPAAAGRDVRSADAADVPGTPDAAQAGTASDGAEPGALRASGPALPDDPAPVRFTSPETAVTRGEPTRPRPATLMPTFASPTEAPVPNRAQDDPDEDDELTLFD